ncbi:MAG TPA: hypothetical protein VMZ28_21895 [Kofleriaceae bacterium]|nr:hypothetical protein [Kofleriaceae bacterium]
MWRSRILAACAPLLLLATLAHADIEGDRYVSPTWRVRITAPKNWQLTDKTAYPSVLLRMVRRAPEGKILLTAERLPAGTDALTYASKTIELLRGMQFNVRAPQLHSSTGAYYVDAQRPGTFLRQAYLVAGGFGYSLTLAAPDHRTRTQHLRAFEFALRSITILRADEVPPPQPAAPADGPAPPDEDQTPGASPK